MFACVLELIVAFNCNMKLYRSIWRGRVWLPMDSIQPGFRL
jgi:hypothetical protein